MEIVREMKLDVTLVEHGMNSGDLPLRAGSMQELEQAMKVACGVDDLHITSMQSFENWQES